MMVVKNDKAEIVKQQLAERFIHCLDDKKEEWSKNWKIGNGACNGISNRKYAGLNRFLLTFYSQEEKYEGNRFYTFNQIKEKGYHLENAKGKGIPIIYPMFNYFKDGATDYSDRKLVGVSKKSEMIRSGEATESNFKWAYASVKYVFSEDLVKEIAHSTSKGLEREVTGEFGSEEYAKEELRAEIASAYICAELGIDTSMNENNNVAYIQSWSTAIKDNYKYLEDAVKDADKICNYVIEKGEVYQNKSLNKQLQKEYQTPSKEHKEKESERDL